jgi:tetratricopeptide (TPR) repeat protein
MRPRALLTPHEARSLAPAFTLTAIAGVLLTLAACSEEPTCRELAAAKAWKEAAKVCVATYQHSGLVSDGADAARSLLWSGSIEEAERLASTLTTSSRAGDAHLVLAEVCSEREEHSQAEAGYRASLAAYRREGNLAGASRAAHGLAGAQLVLGELAGATESSEEALDLAEQGGDLQMQLYARLGHTDLLRRQGLLREAEAGLTLARGLARTPRDRAWVALKHGILFMELGLDTPAELELLRVLELGREVPLPPAIEMGAHLNLAWVTRRRRDLVASRNHVEAAAAFRAQDIGVYINRAMVLADAGQMEAAGAEIESAVQLEPEADQAWWLFYIQGRIAVRLGDEELARKAFERSIESVRSLTARAGSYAPDVAASHRLPFSRLIGVHARRGRWHDVLALVMELDSLSLLSTERVAPDRPRDLATPSGAPRIPRPSLPSVAAVIEAWKGRPLVILASDEEQMWRLQLRDGQLSGELVGSATDLEAQALKLEADPLAAATAAALGDAILPRAAPSSIDLLIIGPLARTPLGALRREGYYLSERTLLSRVLGVLPRRPPTSPRTGSAVLGDPRDDLPSGRAEAIAVAASLRRSPLLGRDATSRALASAASTELLHVAAHAIRDRDGPLLLLADRAVGRAEILAQPTAPNVVVLASCGSAVARDDAGWGSLAAAFLTAGSDFVIASEWSINDTATAMLIEELYRGPVREHPARALAEAQARTRAKLPARTWAGFTVIAAPPAFAP